MFYVDFPDASAAARRAAFPAFADAAMCAYHQARQGGECQVRLRHGALVADFFRNADKSVSVAATDIGRPHVEAWAR